MLWRRVLEATIDTLDGRSRGQYHIGLACPPGIERFFAGLPRIDTDLGGYNVQVPLAPVDEPIPVAATSITVAYIGPQSKRRDWRIPSQRPETAYPLWRRGTGLLPTTQPGTDYLALIRDPSDGFHARWLREGEVAALPESLSSRLLSADTGLEALDAEEWEALVELLAIPSAESFLLPDDADEDVGEAYRPEGEEASTKQPDPFTVDPDVLDRGVSGHRRTQNALARHLEESGREPLSYRRKLDPPFDLAWQEDETLYVAEVKSITDANEEKQLRLGLGQVLRYAHQLRDRMPSVQPVLVAEREPSDGSWHECCASLDVLLVWPETFP